MTMQNKKSFKTVTPKERKKFSICLTGRNDNYGGSFKRRLALSINYLARNAKRIGMLDEIEVIVTDWNSEVPLSQVVRLTADGSRISRFIHVPPEIAKPKNFPQTNFHSSLALNVALRRACGEFLMVMPADILIPEYPLSQLMKLLREELETPFDIRKSCMLISRKYFPYQFRDIENDLSLIDNYLTLNEVRLERAELSCGLAANASALLFYSKICHDLCGFNELMGGHGFSDNDFGLRANEYYPVIDLSFFGIQVYDFKVSSDALSYKQKVINKYIIDTKKNEKWGLSDYDLSTHFHNETAENARKKEDEKDVKYDGESIIRALTGNSIRDYLVSNLYYKIPYVEAFYFPLTWFTLNSKCYKYLEIGSKPSLASLIVSSINPCAEMYFIVPYLETLGYDASPPGRFSDLLLEQKHRGHVRFITGDPRTGMDRLKKTFIGNIYFDLVLIDADVFYGDVISQVEEIIQYIPSGGCLVVKANNLRDIKDFFEHNYPDYTCIVCNEYNVGMFLKARIKYNEGINEKELQDKLKRAWRPFKRKNVSSYLSNLCNLFSKMFLRLAFVDYVRWPSYILGLLKKHVIKLCG